MRTFNNVWITLLEIFSVMMNAIGLSPRIWRSPLLAGTSSPIFSTIYDVACTIFREIVMVVHYSLVSIETTLRQWCWFLSILPRKYLVVSSCNIANLNVMCKCVATIRHPLSKRQYGEVGRMQGLRVTHDLTYDPVSGICLGMSLTFLIEVLKIKNIQQIQLIASAQLLKNGGTETSLRIQALYDALIGIKGVVQAQEKSFFYHLLKDQQPLFQKIQYPELIPIIQTFLNSKKDVETLRQFVLHELEIRGSEITPPLYALVLELDTFWSIQQHPNIRKNDILSSIIIQEVVRFLSLKIDHVIRLKGKVSAVYEQLKNFAMGSYLVSFPRHTVALVKTDGEIALFEPKDGLFLFHSVDDQKEGLSRLLEYYGCNHVTQLQALRLETHS